jgi:hypothetical protein
MRRTMEVRVTPRTPSGFTAICATGDLYGTNHHSERASPQNHCGIDHAYLDTVFSVVSHLGRRRNSFDCWRAVE